jgi:hypothetical protein
MRLITFPSIQISMQTYTIRGLENNSVYEAIVQAKNQYGWNEVINLFNYDYVYSQHRSTKSSIYAGNFH